MILNRTSLIWAIGVLALTEDPNFRLIIENAVSAFERLW